MAALALEKTNGRRWKQTTQSRVQRRGTTRQNSIDFEPYEQTIALRQSTASFFSSAGSRRLLPFTQTNELPISFDVGPWKIQGSGRPRRRPHPRPRALLPPATTRKRTHTKHKSRARTHTNDPPLACRAPVESSRSLSPSCPAPDPRSTPPPPASSIREMAQRLCTTQAVYAA